MSSTNAIRTIRVGLVGTWTCEKRSNTNARRMATPMWKYHTKLMQEEQ
jgi:hypothetical protein